MNVFVLDENPKKAATYHCDSHVRKQILESAQLLCNTFECAPYRKTHINHPATKWVQQSMDHFDWLLELGFALGMEFEFRYGKEHKTLQVLNWLAANKKNIALPKLGLNFICVMPADFRLPSDVVTAYRNYYKAAKQHLFKWTKREVPDWINK